MWLRVMLSAAMLVLVGYGLPLNALGQEGGATRTPKAKPAVSDEGNREQVGTPPDQDVPPPSDQEPPGLPSNQPSARSETLASEDIHRKLLGSTGWVISSNRPNGDVRARPYCFVVDRARKLAVTGTSIISEFDPVDPQKQSIYVHFPRYEDNGIVTDTGRYEQSDARIAAEVFDIDFKRRLVILRLASLPEGIQELPLAPTGPTPGQTLYWIGASGTELGILHRAFTLWHFNSGTVRRLYRVKVPGTLIRKTEDHQAVEIAAGGIPGGLGGPVVDDRGRLVAYQGDYLDFTGGNGSFVHVAEVNGLLDAIRPLLSPESALDFNRRGLHYYHLPNYDRALTDLTQAIRLNPRLVSAYYNRGLAYVQQRNFDRADTDFEKMEQADYAYSLQKLTHYFRQYIKVANRTPETITVHVVYHTKTIKGEWKWYPGPPDGSGSVTFSFKPGETAYVVHDDFRINADQARVWAIPVEGRGQWQFEGGEVFRVTRKAGYLWYYMRTFTLTIR